MKADTLKTPSLGADTRDHLKLKAGLLSALLLGYLGLVFAPNFLWLTASLVLLGLGSMVSSGLAAAQSLAVSDDEQGAVAGLSSAAQALGRMLGPLVGTTLYGLSPAYPYAFSALLIGLALVFFLSRPQLARAR